MESHTLMAASVKTFVKDEKAIANDFNNFLVQLDKTRLQKFTH
jgi:hypothetical protein